MADLQARLAACDPAAVERDRAEAGERALFDPSPAAVLARKYEAANERSLFRTLKEHGMEDCLQLVHCHPGSQLQDIRRVKDAINELAHVYAELKIMGAGLQYIDIGGGLGDSLPFTWNIPGT